MKVSQLRQDIKDIVAEPEAEDIGFPILSKHSKIKGAVSTIYRSYARGESLDLSVLLESRWMKFRNQRLYPEAAQEVYEVNEVQPQKIQIDFEKDQPLAKGVEKKSIDDLVGKKANLVMADQLKVGEVTTASGKKLTRMGGIMFPLIPELKDKIAWASINKNAARNIVYGALLTPRQNTTVTI